MGDLFDQHADIVNELAEDGPTLIPTHLGGLIGRSRTVEKGNWRLNYYIRRSLLNKAGTVRGACKWLVDCGDPTTVCHPVIVVITDLIWV
jgi:hypothetical protein